MIRFVKLNTALLITNHSLVTERRVSDSKGMPPQSPNLKLVPDCLIGCAVQSDGEGREEEERLVNAKIEILGSTDLYRGVGRACSAHLSSLLRGGPDWNAKNQLVFFTCSTLRASESGGRGN